VNPAGGKKLRVVIVVSFRIEGVQGSIKELIVSIKTPHKFRHPAPTDMKPYFALLIFVQFVGSWAAASPVGAFFRPSFAMILQLYKEARHWDPLVKRPAGECVIPSSIVLTHWLT
jgi:hypothetical protein